jgi:hypothetical protein
MYVCMYVLYEIITNYVSDYINLLVKIAHIICNHPLYKFFLFCLFLRESVAQGEEDEKKYVFTFYLYLSLWP